MNPLTARRPWHLHAAALIAASPLIGCDAGGQQVIGPSAPGDTEWLSLSQFLVKTDGTRSLGDNTQRFNSTRDTGTKIVYFDKSSGDNATADVYWWDGTQLVDSSGSAVNPANQIAYGTDPLHPDESAIKPFAVAVGMAENAPADPRLRTNNSRADSVAGGYPDWFLFRRGQKHETFDCSLCGGRSEGEPMVVAAYGPLESGRATIAPTQGVTVAFQGHARQTTNPLSTVIRAGEWHHHVWSGLSILKKVSWLGAHELSARDGGPMSLLAEDCAFGSGEGRLVYAPAKTVLRRCQFSDGFDPDKHNQGYYTEGFSASTTFDEVIFYRNGFKTNPLTDPDPVRTIYDRNVYQGGGAQMGHVYRNTIFAQGGSGSPQMRLGGVLENSLIIEGYFYASTKSGSPVNSWMTSRGQSGSSAIIRNNVQLVYAYPTPLDTDTLELSDSRAHPGWGFALEGASFGCEVTGNIITRAMLENDLGAPVLQGPGIRLRPHYDVYEDGNHYSQRSNTFTGNIIFRVGIGLDIASDGDWSGTSGVVVEGNAFVADRGVVGRPAAPPSGLDQLRVDANRFYVVGSMPDVPWYGSGNSVSPLEEASTQEAWPDPDRTLKRYVTEVLGLQLLEWRDDPFLEPTARDVRRNNGEIYDPTGVKTFMAVAINMRRGGRDPIPSGGARPSLTGDYPWDARFTAAAVVNYVRAGFNLAAVR
jgi:hypothetical protein